MTAKRYYTPDEANRTIVQIEPIVRALGHRVETLRGMRTRGAEPVHRRPAPDTLVDARYFRELVALNKDIQELARLGCVLKDPQSGIVDFPARLEGREVCLCWMLGETSISHWHEVDAGFRGRQPIGEELDFAADRTPES